MLNTELGGPEWQEAASGAVDQTARDAAAAAQSTADFATTPDEAEAFTAPYALANNPSGHIPANRVGETPTPYTVPVVTADSRTFRFVERDTLATGSTVSQATETNLGTVRGATSTQASAASGTTILGWTNNRIRALITAALPTVSGADARAGTSSNRRAWTAQRVRQAIVAGIDVVLPAWARDATTQIPADKLTLAPGGSGTGDDAATWAEEGNTDLIQTAKINYAGVQNQIDTITDELAHSTGPITEVIGQLGSGRDSLRYTIGTGTEGNFYVTVTVKARVQVNDFQNFSGVLRITEDGGGGLNALVPSHNHNYSDHHEATLTFVRRGLQIPAGNKDLLFTTFVTGNNPPDVHFIELDTLKLTPTSLVNSNNVGEYVEDLAEVRHPNVKVPRSKLDLGALALGEFEQTIIDAIPNGGEQVFSYQATVQRDQDSTLAYIGGGWKVAEAGGSAPRWHKVGQWESITDSNQDMTFVANDAFADLAAVVEAFTTDNAQDIAWTVEIGNSTRSPTFIRFSNHDSDTKVLVARHAVGELINVNAGNDAIRIRSHGLAFGTGTLRSAFVTAINLAELWVLV